MKYSEANLGRIFILRLEQGDQIPGVIEDFAVDQGIMSGLVFFLGGAEKNSRIVVGPEDATVPEPQKMIKLLPGVSEAVGIGTLFTNEQEVPRLHMHSAFGRGSETITGCTRDGVDIWLIGEVIILELTNSSATRKLNPTSKFELLEI